MIKGYISYFRIKKGIGFINADDGSSYFFHVSKFLDENAFQGSPVQFAHDPTLHSDKAVDIMTLAVKRDGYGIIKFHNLPDRFGTLYARGGECTFTQVTSDLVFTIGTPVRFADRYITMPDGESKRIAYDITPLPMKCVVRGTVVGWNGTNGILRTADGVELTFDREIVCDVTAVEQDRPADAVVIDGTVRFLRVLNSAPAVMATARIIAINPQRLYALVTGPGIPQGIIGNPPATLRRGDYIHGEFIPNARGFECMRHVVIPRDRIIYGTVSDGATRIHLVNTKDYPPIPLPKEVLVSSKPLPWTPRDGEICECLLAAGGNVAIARQGHPFAAYAILGPSEELYFSSLTDSINYEDRYVLAAADPGHPPLWPYVFRVYERHHADALLGAENRFVKFTAEIDGQSIPCEAFALQLRNTEGHQIYVVFQVVEGRPGRPNRHLLAFETAERANLLEQAPCLPERFITAEGIDF